MPIMKLSGPKPVLMVVLSLVFESAFGNKFMYQHAIKAPDEMRQLHKQFYAYVKKRIL
jgi:2-dehydropantoate 2-reductase